jgi:hypothetical protein
MSCRSHLLLVAAALCLIAASAVPLTPPFTSSDPAHEIYGWGPMYPNTTLGGLIVEGPFPYKNGPAIWNDTLTNGAYGAAASPSGGDCAPVV